MPPDLPYLGEKLGFIVHMILRHDTMCFTASSTGKAKGSMFSWVVRQVDALASKFVFVYPTLLVLD
jgi:hypothetical protein